MASVSLLGCCVTVVATVAAGSEANRGCICCSPSGPSSVTASAAMATTVHRPRAAPASATIVRPISGPANKASRRGPSMTTPDRRGSPWRSVGGPATCIGGRRFGLNSGRARATAANGSPRRASRCALTGRSIRETAGRGTVRCAGAVPCASSNPMRPARRKLARSRKRRRQSIVAVRFTRRDGMKRRSGRPMPTGQCPDRAIRCNEFHVNRATEPLNRV